MCHELYSIDCAVLARRHGLGVLLVLVVGGGHVGVVARGLVRAVRDRDRPRRAKVGAYAVALTLCLGLFGGFTYLAVGPLVAGWTFRLDTAAIAAARIDIYDVEREGYRHVGSTDVGDRDALCHLVRGLPRSSQSTYQPAEGRGHRFYTIRFIAAGGRQLDEEVTVIPNADKRTGVDVVILAVPRWHRVAELRNADVSAWVQEHTGR